MTDARPRVLVLGASGFVGRALVPCLTPTWEVAAPSHAELDVGDREAVRRAVRRVGPTAVILLAARNPGAGDAAEARCAMEAVNARGAACVAEAAWSAGARLVHVSTDCVLDGRDPPYADDAPACPVTDYGRSKAAGEAAVLAAHEEAAVVRTSLVFDPGEMDRGTRGFAVRLAAREPCRLFVDEVRCPIARGTLAAALAELLALPVRGTLNLAGREPLSRHAFGVRLLRWFGVPGLERVEAVHAAGLPEPRPLDLTLDTRRAGTLLATPLRSVEEELAAGARPASPRP